MPRFIKIAIGLSVAIILGAGGVGFVFKEPLAERAALRYMSDLGIQSPRFSLTKLSLNQIQIDDLSIGQQPSAISAKRIQIGYSLAWQGGPQFNIQTVHIDAPKATADIRSGAMTINGLPPLPQSADTSQSPFAWEMLPKTVTISNPKLTIRTASGPVMVSGPLAAQRHDAGGIDVKATVSISHKDGTFAGPVTLAISPQMMAELSANLVAHSPDGDPASLTLSAYGNLAAPDVAMRLDAKAKWGGNKNSRPPWPGLPQSFDGTVSAVMDRAGDGTISATALVGPIQGPSNISLTGAKVALTGRVRRQPGHLSFTPTQTNQIELFGLTAQKAPVLVSPIALQFDQPIDLAWQESPDTGIIFSFDFAINRASALYRDTWLDIPAIAQDLAAHGTWKPGKLDHWTAALSAAKITAREQVSGEIEAVLSDVQVQLDSQITAPLPLLTSLQLSADIRHKKTAIAGQLALKLSDDKSNLAGQINTVARINETAASGHLKLMGDVHLSDQNLRFFAHKGSRITLDAVNLPDDIISDGPVQTTLANGNQPALRINWPKIPDDPFVAQVHLADLRGRFARHEQEAAVAIDQLSATGQWSPKTLKWRGRAQIKNGQINLSPLAINATSLEFDLDINGAANTKPRATVQLTSARLIDRATPARMEPLMLSAKAALAQSKVKFSLNGATAATDLFNLTGQHDLARNEGSAEISTHKLVFGEHDLDLAQLSPMSAPYVENLSGQITASARAKWAPSGLTGHGRVMVQNGAAKTEFAAVAGVDADITFDQLWPPSTPPGQSIKIGTLNAGLPITDMELNFQLQPDRTVHIETLTWPMFRGRMRIDDALIKPDGQSWGLILRADALDLQDMSDQLNVEDLTADGRIDGQIPLRLVGNTLTIDGATFVAKTIGGVIQYTGEAGRAALSGAGEQATLLLDALRDFHYTELSITADGPATGNMTFALHLKGANPDVLDGYPFALNLNIEVDPSKLIQSGSTVYNIPRALQEKLGQD